jgi:hypothetical protein
MLKVISRASFRSSNEHSRYKSQPSFLLQVRHKVETVLIVLLVFLLGDGAHRCPARRKLVVKDDI